MEFRNLTPFAAQCFATLDESDQEYRVVALKVGYQMVIDPATGLARLDVMDDDPVGLCYSDEHTGEPGRSSVYRESDLAPFKPRCDVILQGQAWAPFGKSAKEWPAKLALRRAGDRQAPLMLDKKLLISGPQTFYKDYIGWGLHERQPATQVRLDWAYTFGGSSQIPNPRYAEDPSQPERLLNEVCYSNPLGTGWLHKDHRKVAWSASLPRPDNLPAPQISYPGESFKPPLLVRHPRGEPDARAMAVIAQGYGHRPAGFGILGRAWAPRLQKAGTYDQKWLDERWPLLPRDFGFAYWNGAPEDQQTDYPPPDAVIELLNLLPPECSPHGFVRAPLPGHRAFVLAWLANGGALPLNAVIDTLWIDTDLRQVRKRSINPTCL